MKSDFRKFLCLKTYKIVLNMLQDCNNFFGEFELKLDELQIKKIKTKINLLIKQYLIDPILQRGDQLQLYIIKYLNPFSDLYELRDE